MLLESRTSVNYWGEAVLWESQGGGGGLWRDNNALIVELPADCKNGFSLKIQTNEDLQYGCTF